MLLTAPEYAAKLGIRESQFRRAVRRGELPPPILTCRPQRWADSPLENVNKGSTVQTDALMERINGNPCAVR